MENFQKLNKYIYGKMFDITSYQGNTNQNQSVLSQPIKNGYYQKSKKK